MIYLDHASATPVSPRALAAMQPYFAEKFFNPSAPYLPAHQVRQEYNQAKDQLAHLIGAKGTDLVITSGATESVNLAFTVLDQFLPPASQNPKNPPTPSPQTFTPEEKDTLHSSIIAQNSNFVNPNLSPNTPLALILSTEHPSVLSAATKYPHDVIKVDKTGLIDLADLQSKLTENTRLVSISLANNEIGTIQPLAKVAEIIAAERARRLRSGSTAPLYLHTDASQALALLDISVARLSVDLMTLNSAKVYGPKGVGALYLSRQVKLNPITLGGGQERGLRAGTENVPGVIGFATAAAEAQSHLKFHRTQYAKFTEILEKELEKATIKPLFLGNHKSKLANFCSVSFPGLDAERLIYILESQDILLSTGAACAASKGQKSHVLQALGLSDAEIAGSLRLSLGQTNTEPDIYTAARAIVAAVNQEATRLGLTSGGTKNA